MTDGTIIVHLTLDDGRWLDMHLPTVNQQLDIMELPDVTTPAEGIERVRFWRDTLRSAVVSTSWGSDVGDGLTGNELGTVVNRWLDATEEQAVPLEQGSDSDTQPPEPPSPAPTGGRRKSRSRRSS